MRDICLSGPDAARRLPWGSTGGPPGGGVKDWLGGETYGHIGMEILRRGLTPDASRNMFESLTTQHSAA